VKGGGRIGGQGSHGGAWVKNLRPEGGITSLKQSKTFEKGVVAEDRANPKVTNRTRGESRSAGDQESGKGRGETHDRGKRKDMGRGQFAVFCILFRDYRENLFFMISTKVKRGSRATCVWIVARKRDWGGASEA